jgi:hypothetical protein
MRNIKMLKMLKMVFAGLVLYVSGLANPSPLLQSRLIKIFKVQLRAI